MATLSAGRTVAHDESVPVAPQISGPPSPKAVPRPA